MIAWIIATIWAAGFAYATYKSILEVLIEEHQDTIPDGYHLVAAATSALLASALVTSWGWWWCLAGDWFTGRPGVRQLRRTLAALHAEAKTGRRELANRFVYTFGAHELMLARTRAEERARLVAHLRNIPDDDGPHTGVRRFIDRHDRLRQGTSIAAVLLAAADEIERTDTP